MKLCNDTLATLKNFAQINSNLVVQPGSQIRTMATTKNIFATYACEETFPGPFGIYDLNEFLSVLGMFDNPELTFSDDNKKVTVSEGKTSVTYWFSEPSILVAPSKDVQMPNTDVMFTLTSSELNQIRKAAAALGVSSFVVTKQDGKIVGTLTDVKNKTSNEFSMELDGTTDKDEFKYVFNIANFKMAPATYTVSISDKMISHFSADDGIIQYFIALER